MLCGSSLWKSLKPWVSQQFCWDSRSSDATAIPDANEAPGERSIPLLPRLAGQEIITLAYTGSSPLMQTSSRRLRTARATVGRARPRKPAAVLAFDLFGKEAGPKTSVAVRTRAASRAHTASRCARLQLQRCAGKSTARAAAAYIYLLYRGGSPAKQNR